MSGNNDGQAAGGPRKTAELRGVTFLGGQPGGRKADAYKVKHADGAIEGPYPMEEVLEMIRGGRLAGSEGVSKDDTLWIPIMAVPSFAAEFRARPQDDNSLFGGMDDAPRGGTQLLSPLVSDETRKFDADQLLSDRMARPPAGGGLASGPTLPDPFADMGGDPSGPFGSVGRLGMATSEESVAKSVVTDAGALTGMSGVRRIAPPPPPGDPGASELPLGFGAPPVRGETLPLMDANFPSFESADLPAARELIPPSDLSELPALVGHGDLPKSAYSDLPGVPTQLPRSANANLPGVVAGLPGVAGGLPTSAGGLPGSAGGLPSSAQGLPLSEGRSGAPRPGTQMMTGIGLEEDLPSPSQKKVGEDLPASVRGGATALLNDLGDLDGLFAGPGGVVAGQEPSRDIRQSGSPFDAPSASAADVFDDDPFADMAFSGAGGAASGTRDAFFDEPEPVAPEGERLLPETPEPAAAAPKKAKVKGPGMGGLVVKVVGGVAAVGAIVGGGLFLASMFGGDGDDAVVPVATPTVPEVAPAPVASLGTLEDLRDGSFLTTLAFIDRGRSAVAAGAAPEDRATLAVALLLTVVDRPDRVEDYREASALLEGLSSDAEIVGFAQAALAATAGDEDAPAALAAYARGDLGAWAAWFSAVSHLQAWRGVRYEETVAPVVEEAEGSGEVVAVAAPAELGAEVRTLSPAMATALDDALARDSGLVPARYLRGWYALHRGENDAAIRHFELAVELNAQHIPSWIGLALARLADGELAEADARIQRVIDELSTASAPHERSATYLASARISIARLQPELAIESLLSALQEDPSNRVALEMLGEQFHRAGQYQRAIEYFQPLADGGLASAEVTVALARALIGLGQLGDAATRLTAAMQQYGDDPRFPYLLGRVREEQVEFDDAGELYRQAMQIDPGFVRAYLQLATLEERGGNPTGALSLLDEAAAQTIDDAGLASELGVGYLTIGERNKAVAAFRRALALNTSHPDARIHLTEFYLDNGQNERAIRELDIMVQSGVDSPRVRYLHARALSARGDYDRAIEELLSLIEQDASNADYLMLMGISYFFSGSVDRAREFFVRALDAAPDRQEAQFYIGRADLERGALNDAIAALTAVAQRSSRGEFHYWLGRALERGGQNAQALAEYTQAIDNDVAWSLEEPDVFHRRGRIYHRRGAYGASYRDLRVLLTLRPRHADGAWTMGQYYYDQRDYPAAIAMMELSLEVQANQPSVSYWLGRAYLDLSPPQPQTAVRYLEQARDQGYASTQTDLLRRLGYVYRDTGRRPDAVAAFRGYLELPNLSADDRREVENEIRRLGGNPL